MKPSHVYPGSVYLQLITKNKPQFKLTKVKLMLILTSVATLNIATLLVYQGYIV